MWKSTVFVSTLALYLGSTPAMAQRPPAGDLPEGPGKELVEAACTSCHPASTILRAAGYGSAEQWHDVFSSMIKLPEAQARAIARYLAEHFPEKPDRRPTLVPGAVEIDIEEWIVPTLGQRARDPIEAPDGAIWWTGMWASLVGQLDPQTGQMQEFALPPQARPHSIVPDRHGKIWYTGNSNATIGRIEKNTCRIEKG